MGHIFAGGAIIVVLQPNNLENLTLLILDRFKQFKKFKMFSDLGSLKIKKKRVDAGGLG